MVDYNTKAVTIGGVTVTVSKKADGSGSAGERLTAFLEWLASRNHPDQGLPPAPGTPDNSLPSGGRPDNSLPSGGRPDNSLPGSGGRPDQGLPGSGGRPDNSLPGDFLRKHADEIAKAVLGHCFDCKPSEPKK